MNAFPAAAALSFLVSLALAQNDYGIDFVRIGAVNNPAFDRPTFPSSGNWPAVGSGSVAYEYRMGRTEVTSAQWMLFVNTFGLVPREDAPPFFDWSGPYWWGAGEDPTYHGPGFRYVLHPDNPNAGMRPVFGISWRQSALYCNWLHNGQSTDPASLLTGAYDVSTWGSANGGSSFTDALTHLPDARFWIPTFNEQIKAFHYDPHRYGPGQGGWWLDKNGRDTPGIPGPPGIGTTSAGFTDPVTYNGQLEIPLGAYPDHISPWGLLDTSGGATEWSELPAPRSGPPGSRLLFGASAGRPQVSDSIYGRASGAPGSSGLFHGLRLASSIPQPGPLLVLGAYNFSIFRDRKRKFC